MSFDIINFSENITIEQIKKKKALNIFETM